MEHWAYLRKQEEHLQELSGEPGLGAVILGPGDG